MSSYSSYCTICAYNSACIAASGPDLYGGDILLTPAQKASMDTSRLLASQWEDVVALWNDARVPYVFDSSLCELLTHLYQMRSSVYVCVFRSHHGETGN